ncbi:DUF1801 domain-containing protein [Micromonospora sp. NPDC005806]|uniref:DUF1801 domain-containing protein n=1 Tax=Micromonospora sp. NPDC005806 TaxID=3364234 RepID=UPI0036847F93
MDLVSTYLSGLDGPLRETGEKLRTVIDAALPEATGVMWHGHPVWGLGDRPGRTPICLVKAYPSYLTFGLWRGQDVDDETGRLAAGARRMASVKLRTVDEIDPELFTGWLRRAYDLETR